MKKLIRNFKYWENYKMYLDLMKKFVDKKISGTEFSDQFFQMWKSDRDKTYNSEELVYITENFKLTEINAFSSFISDLFLDFYSNWLYFLIVEKYRVYRTHIYTRY